MSGFTFDGKLLCREVCSCTLTYGFALNCNCGVNRDTPEEQCDKMLNFSVQLSGGEKSDL